MKSGRGKDAAGASPGHPATTRVTEPRLTVVEGAQLADPAALNEALELLVTWAIRGHQGRCSAAADSVTCEIDRACEGSN